MPQQVDTLVNRTMSSEEDSTSSMASKTEERSVFNPKHAARQRKEMIFRLLIVLATCSALGTLLVLLAGVIREGWHWLDAQFLDSFPSRFPHKAGIKSAIWGSIWLGSLTLFFSVIFGVGASIYLEELSPKNKLNKWLEINIATLAGVPSIIYGMLGLTLFVRFLNLIAPCSPVR